MRVRPLLLSAPVAALSAAVLAAGCGSPAPTARPGPDQPAAGGAVDVGPPLYDPKPAVAIKAAPRAAEPLVVPNCTVQYDLRQVVSSEVEGKIDLLAVEDPGIGDSDPDLVFHPRDLEEARRNPAYRPRRFRQVREGVTRVQAGQVLCLLDDQLVTTRRDAAARAEKAAEDILKSAGEGVKLTIQKMALTKEALDKKTAGLGEYLQDQITLTRFQENEGNAKQAISKAQSDREEAGVMLRKHHIAAAVTGVVRTIQRRRGYVVKAGEPILEIQATDVVRLEGNLDVQYADEVRRRMARPGGLTVSVEPSVPSAPVSTRSPHRQEVTGVAVTSDPARPLVVSTGADGTAVVWDVTKDTPDHALPHPQTAVRSVACSPPGSRPVLAVTGADDGRVRVWDLSDPDRLPAAPKELADAHTAAVGVVAFAPEGRFFATAAGREVFVWAADGRKLYALPPDHRDAVTSLAFTPQGTLVTASRDRSLKVWKLGAEKAACDRTIDHRAGVVDVLGVTKDGGRVVFDQDKNRLDLVGLADRRTTGQVRNLGPTAAFGTLAVFNSDDTFLVTAGGEGELKGGLQVWSVPTDGGRGREEARLFTTGRVGVTAAAFSGSPQHPFLVVGTEKGELHLWKPPAADRKAYTGKVVNVDPTDPRYVTVRVEMDNRQLNLPDRSAATVVINPGQ